MATCHAGKNGDLSPIQIAFVQSSAIANEQSIFGELMDQQIRSGGRPQSGQRCCPLSASFTVSRQF
jgi:hypothetical protein